MKYRWDLTVDNTKQILGGFLEEVKDMTEKQVIAYVRKIAKDFVLSNSNIDKYGVWVEEVGNGDHSFHITASRSYDKHIDILVYDALKGEHIVDTYHDRMEKERREFNEQMNKFCEEHGL